MGYDPLKVNAEQFTTPQVINELRSKTIAYTRLKLALETGKLKMHTPSTAALEEIEEASRKLGDLPVLSKADKEVLATALELSKNRLNPKLVSDDYAIQNIAESLNIKYTSLTTFGIRYRFKWVLYCPACKRKYPPDTASATVCTVCGTQLKRRVLRKEAVKGK